MANLKFPTTLFHKDLAPEGQVFMTEADLPSAEGWVDTPAAFVAGYTPPPAVEQSQSVPADAPVGFVPLAYPSHRYKVGDPDNPKTVATAEEDAALEAAEPGVWQHSPDPKATPAAAGAETGPSDPNALGDFVPGADGQPVVLSAAQRDELYTAKVADVVVKVSAISSPRLLEAIAAAETENPKGARVTVGKAVTARLAELRVAAD